MSKYYDKLNNRLVFIQEKADSNFWDNKWIQDSNKVKYNTQLPRYNIFLNLTRKYLNKGDLILEGGCGLAKNSYNFHLAGYRVIALDYAEETISFLKKKIPEVNPVIGDVRKLEFKEESIDGYWSFGVIEHFFEGYELIAKEAKRVIKKGGYLFITFPHMSRQRRLKALLVKYPLWSEDIEKKLFYQFALNKKSVIEYFSSLGFVVEETRHLEGLGGLINENTFGRQLVIAIINSNNILIKILRRILDKIISPFSSHIILLVLKKV